MPWLGQRDVLAEECTRRGGVHAVVDVRMVVVEFLVAVRDAGASQRARELPATVMALVLVAPAAIDVDTAHGFQVAAVAGNQIGRIVLLPPGPASLDHKIATFNEAPWGGYKMSGYGRDLGVNGLLEYQQVKQVATNLKPGPLGWYAR